jgi:hypothetical protein
VSSTAATTQWLQDALGFASYDSYMKTFYPEEYGRDPEDPLSDLSTMIFPTILVYVQFSNPGGASEPYDSAFCDRVKAAMAPCDGWWVAWQNDDEHVPLSKLNFQWIYSGVREFDYPYIKNAQVSTQTTFPGWAEFAANWIGAMQDQIQNGLMVFTQCQHFGGPNSAMYKNKDNGTAYSWRDATIGFNMDLFYDVATSPDAKARAEKFQELFTAGAIGPSGIFSKQDLRWFWASHGDDNLDRIWPAYLSPSAHQTLLGIKAEYDPRMVFSPNAFCIGGAKPPAKPRGVRLVKDAATVDDKVNVATLRAAVAAGQKRSEL